MNKIEIFGLENLQQEQGFIIATNHIFWLDLLQIAAFFKEKKIFKAKPYILSLSIFKFFNYILTKFVNPIYISRNNFDYDKLLLCIKLLQEGKIIILSPEGKHNRKKLLQAKSGVAFLAHEANVPIIPIGIYKKQEKNKYFSKKVLTVKISEPIEPGTDLKPDDLKQLTKKVMLEIAKLLPENQRGFYK